MKKNVDSKNSKIDTPLKIRVFRSNKHIYAQIIDSNKNLTLTSLSSKALKLDKKMTKRDTARLLGINTAKKLSSMKAIQVVFDRAGYKYLGRVKELAEGIREGGIKI